MVWCLRMHMRLTAALLIPLLAFGPSCVTGSRQGRLQFEKGEVIVTPQAMPPVEVSEVELKQAAARLSQDAELMAVFSRPKATRLHLFPASFSLHDALLPGAQHPGP